MLLLLINGTWRVPPYFILVSLWPPRIHGRWLWDRAFPVRHYCKCKQKVIMPSELIELNSVLYKFSKLSWLLSPQIFRYLCMSPERFKHLLTLVGPLITKKTTKMREPQCYDICLMFSIDLLEFVDEWINALLLLITTLISEATTLLTCKCHIQTGIKTNLLIKVFKSTEKEKTVPNFKFLSKLTIFSSCPVCEKYLYNLSSTSKKCQWHPSNCAFSLCFYHTGIIIKYNIQKNISDILLTQSHEKTD